jgi:hypothetical protein
MKSHPEKVEATGDCIMRSFMICTPHQILCRWSCQGQWHGLGMWYTWGEDAYSALVGKYEERPLWRPGSDGRKTLQWMGQHWLCPSGLGQWQVVGLWRWECRFSCSLAKTDTLPSCGISRQQASVWRVRQHSQYRHHLGFDVWEGRKICHLNIKSCARTQPVHCSVVNGGSFSGGNLAMAWIWPLTYTFRWGLEWVELYLHLHVAQCFSKMGSCRKELYVQSTYPTETALGCLLIFYILKIRHKMHRSEKTQSTTVPMVHGKLPVFAELPTALSAKTQMVFCAWCVLSVTLKTTCLGHWV